MLDNRHYVSLDGGLLDFHVLCDRMQDLCQALYKVQAPD